MCVLVTFLSLEQNTQHLSLTGEEVCFGLRSLENSVYSQWAPKQKGHSGRARADNCCSSHGSQEADTPSPGHIPIDLASFDQSLPSNSTFNCELISGSV